jgi:hypothetical protein
MKRIALLTVTVILALAAATPAFAATTTAGRDYGLHHATHAQEMTGFTGTENPGVMHQGFSGWTGM